MLPIKEVQVSRIWCKLGFFVIVVLIHDFN